MKTICVILNETEVKIEFVSDNKSDATDFYANIVRKNSKNLYSLSIYEKGVLEYRI